MPDTSSDESTPDAGVDVAPSEYFRVRLDTLDRTEW